MWRFIATYTTYNETEDATEDAMIEFIVDRNGDIDGSLEVVEETLLNTYTSIELLEVSNVGEWHPFVITAAAAQLMAERIETCTKL